MPATAAVEDLPYPYMFGMLDIADGNKLKYVKVHPFLMIMISNAKTSRQTNVENYLIQTRNLNLHGWDF